MPNNKVIIGIHSNVGSDKGLADGHAWITVTRNGVTTTYGLWPDNHTEIIKAGLSNGDASDIRENFKYDYTTTKHNRYQELTTEQALQLESALRENIEWGYFGNCSNWAGKVFNEVTGHDIDYSDYFFISTPRELGKSIEELEKIDPTSLAAPAPARDKDEDKEKSSSSLFSDIGEAEGQNLKIVAASDKVLSIDGTILNMSDGLNIDISQFRQVGDIYRSMQDENIMARIPNGEDTFEVFMRVDYRTVEKLCVVNDFSKQEDINISNSRDLSQSRLHSIDAGVER